MAAALNVRAGQQADNHLLGETCTANLWPAVY